MAPFKPLGREPAQWISFLSAGLILLSATLLPLTNDQQGAIIGLITIVFGFITAAVVSGEKRRLS